LIDDSFIVFCEIGLLKEWHVLRGGSIRPQPPNFFKSKDIVGMIVTKAKNRVKKEMVKENTNQTSIWKLAKSSLQNMAFLHLE
jgi:hypothetical protein